MISIDSFCASRRRFLAGLLLILAAALLPVITRATETKADILRATLLHGPRDSVFITAHRADWRNFPENSLPAIEGSIAQGLAMVEIDLQRTKDGELVLMHDATLDRTTTGQGRVSDFTLVEIRGLKLRDGLGSATRFEVPTLREALGVARGRVLLNLDKGYRFLREALPILEETGTAQQVLLKGPASVDEVLAENFPFLSKVTYMPVASFKKAGGAAFVRDWVRKAKPVAIEFVFTEWNEEVAEAFALCRENEVRIWVNTLWPQLAGGLSDDLALTDPEGVYGVLLDRGVSIIQTDRPLLLQAYLARRLARVSQ